MLVSAAADPLPPHLSPEARDAGGTSGKKLFLYCAFEQKQGRDAGDCTWVKGESAYVTFAFSNPFLFPVQLDIVDVLCEGDADITLLPTSVLLPPASPSTCVHCKVLPGVTSVGGDGMILGCKVHVWNFAVDMIAPVPRASAAPAKGGGKAKGGKAGGKAGESADPRRFTLVEPLPVAMLTCEQIGGVAFSGEERWGLATIRNAGSLPITEASVVGTPPGALRFDAATLTSALPLHPRASVVLPVSLSVPLSEGDASAHLRLTYSAGGAWRTCEHHVTVHVDDGPVITSMQIVRWAFPSGGAEGGAEGGAGSGRQPSERAEAVTVEEGGGGAEGCTSVVLEVSNKSRDAFTIRQCPPSASRPPMPRCHVRLCSNDVDDTLCATVLARLGRIRLAIPSPATFLDESLFVQDATSAMTSQRGRRPSGAKGAQCKGRAWPASSCPCGGFTSPSQMLLRMWLRCTFQSRHNGPGLWCRQRIAAPVTRLCDS